MILASIHLISSLAICLLHGASIMRHIAKKIETLDGLTEALSKDIKMLNLPVIIIILIQFITGFGMLLSPKESTTTAESITDPLFILSMVAIIVYLVFWVQYCTQIRRCQRQLRALHQQGQHQVDDTFMESYEVCKTKSYLCAGALAAVYLCMNVYSSTS